ncbi:MAG TPA: hypothetical protein VNI20_01065 [Fimbriimonadaceae bacterium]|nr:hypothetical protein [Fimbriimonadaceae bacterium]
MFSARPRSSKRFPHLTSFLGKVVEKRLHSLARLANVLGCGLVALATPVVALSIGLLTANIGAGLLAATVALPASVLGWYLIDRHVKKPKTPEEARRMEAWKVAGTLHTLGNQRRLHKVLDPTISQLLEACAYHYERIEAALKGEYWANENLPAHWRSVRSQSMEAADQAMEELLMLAAPCMGEPQSDKGRVFKETVEDFFELDFANVLGGLREIAGSDWTRFAHRSPNAPAAFEAGRKIAERLKRLADEIESKTATVAQETGGPVQVDSAVESIDVVLSEISAVKEAEQELQQRVGPDSED